MIIDSPIISGSSVASGSLNQLGNVTITGSLNVTGGITGSISGSAITASYASNAELLDGLDSTVFTLTSSFNTFTSSLNAFSASQNSFTASINAFSASILSYTSSLNAKTSSFATTGSNAFVGTQTITGSVNVSGSITSTGTINAQILVVQTITSSTEYSSGSNTFGNSLSNTQILTGSVTVTGSLAVNGSNVVLSNQTSSMSASYALTATSASYATNALTASYALVAAAGGFPYTGSALITGSLGVTGSINVTGSITGSLLGTASYATTASAAPLYLPLAGGTLTGNLLAAGRYFQFQDLILGYGTTQGTIKTDGTKNIEFYPTNGVQSTRFWANGNITIQTGGTYTDNGFKLDVSGSGRYTNGLTVTGSLNVTSGVTGSLLGTASFATTASYWSGSITNALSSSFATSASQALTASYLSGYVSPFPFTGSAIISGSLTVTGSVAVDTLSGSGVRYLVADSGGNITAQSASAALKSTQAFTATAGQTTFSVTNGYSTGYVDVFINGSKLNSTEFTDTSGTNIVLATGSFVNDIVEVVKYNPAAGVTNNALRQITYFTASAGQTVFSASYTPGLIDIFYNGSKLDNSEYTANNGTYFTLATASAAGDKLEVDVYSYQVGAFSGIGGTGTANQIAYFSTTSSITGSPNLTVSGNNVIVTGSLTVFTGSAAEFQVNQTGIKVGNVSTDTHTVTGSLNISGSVSTTGTITAQTLVVQTITSSVSLITGSTQFGSLLANTHVFSGSVTMNPNGLFVSSSGNVGVGTTNPSDPFVVQTNINAQKNVTFQNINTTDSATRQGLYLIAGNRTLSFLALHNDHVYIQGTAGANLYFQQTAGGTVNMTINSSGNVGMGTSDFTSIGSGDKSLRVQASSGTSYVQAISGDGACSVSLYSGGSSADNPSLLFRNSLRFGTTTDNATGGYTERMRITSAGVVQIGNTSYSPYLQFRTGGGTSYHAKMVTDNANDEFSMAMGTDVGYAYGPYIHQVGKDRYGTNTAGWIDYSAGNASGNTTYGYHAFATANTLRMQISYNGAIGTTAGGTNIYNPSDIRLKRNIVPISYGLNAVMALKPSKFNWKEKFAPSEEDKDMLGFIAQEIQEVIPEAIEPFGDNVHVKVDDVEYTVENPLRVNEKFIIPVLVKAIQEQQTQIQSLQAEINELKNK